MLNAFTGIIRGRVQGVGFRYFAKNVADELNLTGWVRNLPDGTVEVLALGPEIALEQFMQRLRIGPLGSRVQSTQFHPLQESEAFERFEIRG
jgi:acylphosphatase